MILTGIECIKSLNDLTKLKDETSSSYWNHYHSDFYFDGKNFHGLKMLGDVHYNQSVVKKTLYRVIDKLFQFKYQKYLQNKKRFKKLNRINKEITKVANNSYNLSKLRHTLTLDFLLEVLGPKLKKNPNVCVIGDGYAMMSSLLIATKSASKVFLINLNKSLLLDLVSLKNTFPNHQFLESICLVSDKESLIESFDLKYKVVAISSMNLELLQYCPIDLAINICSMQEMDNHIIKKYFDYMRKIASERTMFCYCCNREVKKLPDGTVIDFFKYPWNDSDDILVDELCPWLQEYYSVYPPFFHSYDGDHRHRLVKL